MSRQERRRITYRIEVAGPHDEHRLEVMAEWGLDALIELFSQEGYTVKDHESPIISIRIPPKPKAAKP